MQAAQSEIQACEAAKNVKYSGRPDVTECQEHFVCDGYANEIVHNLYLGSLDSVTSHMAPQLKILSVRAIVNCTMDREVPCALEGQGVEYARVAVRDEDMSQILPYLDGATEFIHRYISQGIAVLVHCQRGVSRSGSVIIAYLMRYHGMSRDSAYVTAKTRRSMVSPNVGCVYFRSCISL